MIINDIKIKEILATKTAVEAKQVSDIIQKALELKGLNLEETAILLNAKEPELINEIFAAANQVKEQIYGKRLVIFAPLYISNLCSNNCSYCAFRTSNKELKRRYLTQSEITQETELLIRQGQKRIVLLAGEAYPDNNIQYLFDAIETIYKIKQKNTLDSSAIRRINVNIAPLTLEEFKLLKACNIGTYQLFQETYDRKAYKEYHLGGKKQDYDWRLTAIDRAMTVGIDDIGLGALFGLADWRFEVLALLQHAEYLSKTFGVGPHTISVPRIEPAMGSELSTNPPCPITDQDFCKIIAILRLAVPYTGIIMSTRETPALRRETFALGVSQLSAGSRTNPGGYTEDTTNSRQFDLGDSRTLDEIVQDVASLDYIPSFCTACYRSGRTGENFMCLAKPGAIKNICAPNGLITFQEYLLDHASAKTRKIGEALIEKELSQLPKTQRQITEKMIAALKAGNRDLFV